MHRKGLFFGGLLIAVYVLYPLMAVSNEDGALALRTGAPLPGGGFEKTCGSDSTCHDDFELNSGPGSLTITTAPDQYVPGEPVTITIRVDQESQIRFGFQVTVKDAANDYVGRLELVDANTQYALGNNQNYVTHDRASSQNEWTVRWVAPPSNVGPVTIYASGNAAANIGSSMGDYIYTTNKTLSVSTGTAVEEEGDPLAFTVARAYPNPFLTQTTIAFTLGQAAPVTLALYDALGREVRFLDLGRQAPGTHQVHLDAEGLPAGLYLYEIRTPVAHTARPLMLLK